MTLRIGYEVGSGRPVDVPLQHTAVYGLTRQAGKTTALEGMCSRVGTTVLVLRTGRNELPFDGAHRVRPFFRERYDWKYVEGLLWSFLQERPKVYRTWVMRATQGAESLKDVHAKIVAAGKKATRGWDQDLLYQLDHYFQEILPGLASLNLSTELELRPSVLNVMDIEGVNLPTQQLVVAAVLEYAMGHLADGTNLIVVLPEARDFLPSDRSTPAKLAADQFVRRGAKLGLYLWIDSQSLTGVDQQVVRNFGLSLHGRQTSDIEIRRIVKAAGHGIVAKDIKGLGLGQFLLEDRDGVRKVYVQPAWLTDATALKVARGEVKAESVRPPAQHKSFGPREETNVDAKERKEYEDRIAELERARDLRDGRIEQLAVQVNELTTRVKTLTGKPGYGSVTGVSDYEGPLPPVGDVDTPGPPTREPVHLETRTSESRLTAHVVEKHVDAKLDDSDSRLGALIAEGFFDTQRANSNVRDEMRARGWGSWIGGGGNDSMNELLGRFNEWGFLRRVEGNKKVLYSVIPEAKARITIKRESR